MTIAGVVSAILLLAATAREARAQDTSRTNSGLVAFTVGIPGVASEAMSQLFTLGIALNGFRPNAISPELAVGTMPYGLADGFAVFGMRAGLAVPAVISERAVLLPSAGVSGAMAIGLDAGATAAPGAYMGIATVIGSGRTSAFRAGVTWHHFSSIERMVWLLEAGVVRPFRR